MLTGSALGAVALYVLADEYVSQKEANEQRQHKQPVVVQQPVYNDPDTTQHINVTPEGERAEQSPYVTVNDEPHVKFNTIPTSTGNDSVGLRFDYNEHKRDRNISHILNTYAADESLSGIPNNRPYIASNQRTPNHFDKRRLEFLTGDHTYVEQVKKGARPNIFGGYEQDYYGPVDTEVYDNMNLMAQRRESERMSLVREKSGRAPFEIKILRGANRSNPLSTGIDTPAGEAPRFRARNYTANGAGVAFYTPDVAGGLVHKSNPLYVHGISGGVQAKQTSTVVPITRVNTNSKATNRPIMQQNERVGSSKIRQQYPTFTRTDNIRKKVLHRNTESGRRQKHTVVKNPLSFRQIPRGDSRIRVKSIDTRNRNKQVIHQQRNVVKHQGRMNTNTSVNINAHIGLRRQAKLTDTNRLKITPRDTFSRSSAISNNLIKSTDTTRRNKGVNVQIAVRNDRRGPTVLNRNKQIFTRTSKRMPIQYRKQLLPNRTRSRLMQTNTRDDMVKTSIQNRITNGPRASTVKTVDNYARQMMSGRAR